MGYLHTQATTHTTADHSIISNGPQLHSFTTRGDRDRRGQSDYNVTETKGNEQTYYCYVRYYCGTNVYASIETDTILQCSNCKNSRPPTIVASFSLFILRMQRQFTQHSQQWVCVPTFASRRSIVSRYPASRSTTA